MARSRPPVTRRLQKVGLILIGVSVLFLLGQPALKWGADYYLRESAKIPVRIGHLFINPATSRVSLSLQGEKPDQELKLDLGAVRFDWWTVFLKRLRLGNVSLQGLQLEVEKKSDGQMVIGGIPLAPAPPQASSAPSSSPTPAPASTRRPWGVGAGQIDIQNVNIHYSEPDLDLVILIHRIHLDPAESWHPDRPTSFDADFKINGGHFLLHGTCRPFRDPPDLSIRLDVSDFPLGGFAALAHYPGLDGTMGGTFVVDDFEMRPSSGTPALRLRNFEVSSGTLTLIDRSVRPEFRWRVAPVEVNVSNIDTADPLAVIPYSVEARPGRYEKIHLKGRWRPFGLVPDGTVDLKIDGLNLTAFTPYTQKSIGYRVGTGLFDLKTQAEVKEGLLHSTHGLVAHKLHFEKLNADEMDESSKQIGLPLNLCLGLLRDADDNIRLDVPLEGDLRDPKVPVGKLIWTLIGKALLAALRAAATAFFPSGGKMGFDPIVFAPGQAVLSPEAQAYLAKVGEKMAQRPEVGLKLSGLSAPADWYAFKKKTPPTPAAALNLTTLSSDQKEKLLTLATQRAEAMRSYLVETKHIDPKRLPDAVPQIDPQAISLPRAELSLQ